MKFAKRFLCALLAMVMLVSLTACSNAPASSGGGNPGAGTGTDTNEEQIKLQWWVADPESWCAGYREIVRVYEEAHPNIKIDFATYPENLGEKMKAAQAAGIEPDIYGTTLACDGGDGLFLDLTPYLEADGIDVDEMYYQPYFDQWCKLDGKVYALPRDIFSTVICYNKDLFDAAELPYPEDGWTMEEFIETATKLTDAENKQFGVLFTDDFYTYFPLIWSFGADPMSEDGTEASGYMNSDNMEKFYQYLYDLVYTWGISPTPSQMNAFGEQSAAGGGTSNIFQMGKVAMTSIERYAIGDYTGANMNIGVVSFPVAEDGTQWAYGSMPTWSVSLASKHPEEAYEFLKFATGPEGSRILAETGYFFPAVKSVAKEMGFEEDPIDSVFLAQLDEGNQTKMPWLWRRPADWEGVYSPDLQGPWDDCYNKIMVSRKDIRESIDKAAADMDKSRADYLKQKGVA